MIKSNLDGVIELLTFKNIITQTPTNCGVAIAYFVP